MTAPATPIGGQTAAHGSQNPAAQTAQGDQIEERALRMAAAANSATVLQAIHNQPLEGAPAVIRAVRLRLDNMMAIEE